MHILFYNEIKLDDIPNLDKVVHFLKTDDFKSAQVKKVGDNLYRARLNKADRLLFALYKTQQKTVALILEHIKNHAYEKSRFLRRGVTINEQLIPSFDQLGLDTLDNLPHLQQTASFFHLLQKPITFDSAQQQIYELSTPIIIIGTAGSGKTILLLEKMKQLHGDILYITQSTYLAKHSQNLYFSHQFSAEHQSTSFLCYQDYLDSIAVQTGKRMTFPIFKQWFSKHLKATPVKDVQALYEEFKGVITGTAGRRPYLSFKDYLDLGVRECIFPLALRKDVYQIFERYLEYLQESDYYDHNLVSFDYLSLPKKQFQYLVVDEVQDFSPIQLQLLLSGITNSDHFILCGDANQVVYPNFFSWTRIKSLFFSVDLFGVSPSSAHDNNHSLTQILNTNYRNSNCVIKLANNLLRIKHWRFGSIDRESHYEMKALGLEEGQLRFFSANHQTLEAINKRTHTSKNFAVIVLYEALKPVAASYFKTPLIFSIQECKGLEYENIILFNMISCAEEDFSEVCYGVTPDILNQTMTYSRNKDKSDKSLEKYKFFINALFVAVTRAQVNLLWIEQINHHPLLHLLNPDNTEHSADDITYQTSDANEWQQEASTLEKQGMSEQAEHIRQHILQQQNPPWEVIAGEKIGELFNAALFLGDKKAKLGLFEYALVYADHAARNALIEIGFKPALHPEDGMERLILKYFMMYQRQQVAAIKRQMLKYGVDFRNPFNQTPLMIGAWLGKDEVIVLANSLNADPLLANNLGFNAFQIALEQACLNQSYALDKLEIIYPLLRPDSLRIRINNRLFQLDHHQPEFFFIHLMIALFYRILPESMVISNGAFSAQNLAQAIKHWPGGLLPDAYYSADFIDSLLSRHQVLQLASHNEDENRDDNDSDDMEILPLFYQINTGHYLLNPAMMLEAEGCWLNVYDILWFDDLSLSYQNDLAGVNPNLLYKELLASKVASYKQTLRIG